MSYALRVNDEQIPLNALIGSTVSLEHTGNIYCSNCGRRTKRSFAQGHCYPCMQKLAACDLCILKPETCHYHLGTCREPEWADGHCMIPHIVYLANTSGLKVGITRESQVPTRWMDQGATQALPIFRVATRRIAGLVEVALAQMMADKTNWRALLKGDSGPIDLTDRAFGATSAIDSALEDIRGRFGPDSIEAVDAATVTIRYPVSVYPETIKSFNFDKDPVAGGTLTGIKGQYLMFDTGVINVRKFTGYEIEATTD